MKLKYRKSTKMWEVVSEIFEAPFAKFPTKKEAEYYLSNQFGYRKCHRLPLEIEKRLDP